MIDWDALVEEHGPLVVGISWRILGNAADVEDNVQEVFLAAWRFQESQKVEHWRGLLRRLATTSALARLRCGCEATYFRSRVIVSDRFPPQVLCTARHVPGGKVTRPLGRPRDFRNGESRV